MIKLPHKMRLLSTLLYYDKEEILKYINWEDLVFSMYKQ
jgi:hypothetical protein